MKFDLSLFVLGAVAFASTYKTIVFYLWPKREYESALRELNNRYGNDGTNEEVAYKWVELRSVWLWVSIVSWILLVIAL